jgi:hypothetical protein
MSSKSQKKIVRLLGVGFDGDDGHVRITTGDTYDVLMGSDESHDYISSLIARIENELKTRGLDLDTMTPAELSEIVKSMR